MFIDEIFSYMKDEKNQDTKKRMEKMYRDQNKGVWIWERNLPRLPQRMRPPKVLSLKRNDFRFLGKEP